LLAVSGLFVHCSDFVFLIITIASIGVQVDLSWGCGRSRQHDSALQTAQGQRRLHQV
jgi:hypothetical protein